MISLTLSLIFVILTFIGSKMQKKPPIFYAIGVIGVYTVTVTYLSLRVPSTFQQAIIQIACFSVGAICFAISGKLINHLNRWKPVYLAILLVILCFPVLCYPHFSSINDRTMLILNCREEGVVFAVPIFIVILFGLFHQVVIPDSAEILLTAMSLVVTIIVFSVYRTFLIEAIKSFRLSFIDRMIRKSRIAVFIIFLLLITIFHFIFHGMYCSRTNLRLLVLSRQTTMVEHILHCKQDRLNDISTSYYALVSAVENSDQKLLELLLNSGANPNQSPNTISILHFAVRKKRDIPVIDGGYIETSVEPNVEVVKLLVKHGAMLNNKTSLGESPLHYSVSNGTFLVSSLLLKLGADPNLADCNGNLPIHIAARKDDIEMVNVLIDAGTNIMSKNSSGLTPLEIAGPKCKKVLIKNSPSP